MYSTRHQRGFTIIELLTVAAVIAILGAIAMVGYQEYTARAKASGIILKYDAVKTGATIRLASGGVEDCDKLAKGLGRANLDDAYAKLSYGFEGVSGGGYRPVLNVCAKIDGGSTGVKVARGMYDTMIKVASVEKNPVLLDDVVSFSLPLTAPDKAYCKNYTAPATQSCTVSPSPTAASAATAVSAPTARPVSTNTAAPVTAASPLAQQVQAALARPGTTKDDLTNLFRQQAASLPDALKTVGIPGTSAAAKDILSRCTIDTSKNADEYAGSCNSDFPGMCTECFVAGVCQKSCGVVDGITPEMQAALDKSRQDFEAWMSRHPGCGVYLGAAPECQGP